MGVYLVSGKLTGGTEPLAHHEISFNSTVHRFHLGGHDIDQTLSDMFFELPYAEAIPRRRDANGQNACLSADTSYFITVFQVFSSGRRPTAHAISNELREEHARRTARRAGQAVPGDGPWQPPSRPPPELQKGEPSRSRARNL